MYDVVERNLRAAMRAYALIGGGAEAREYPGVVLASSGLNVAVFNSAMLTAATSSLEPLIATADTHFSARGLGWTFWLCEDLLKPHDTTGWMRSIFQYKGMLRIGDPPGMFADRLSPPVRPPAEMTFAPVTTQQTRLEFAHVASVVFSLTFGVSQRIYTSPGIWEPPCRGWIGYSNGNAVSIITTVFAADSVGVYSLGTLPQYQGRGFGETLMRHALEEARREWGVERSVLQATTQGMRLYLRMGYRVVTKFSIYMREGCASF